MTDAPDDRSSHDPWRESCARLDAEDTAKQTLATNAIGRTLRHDGWTPER